MSAARNPRLTPLDQMVANRQVPSAPSDQIAAFSTAMHSCVGVDTDGHPALDPRMVAYIDQLANEIGRTDSRAPGFDSTSPAEARKMPAQGYISQAYEATMADLGTEIDQKIALARLGKPITTARPDIPSGKGPLAALWSFIRHHWIIGVVVLVVGMIEYFVGIQWLLRARLAPDDASAHLVALGIPLLSAAIAIVGASVVNGAMVRNPKAPRSSRPVQLTTLILGVVLYLGTLFGGGFLLAQGQDVTDDERKVVIFLIYVGFAIGGMLVIFAAHLFELERDWEADRNALADRRVAEGLEVAPSAEQVTESNIAILSQYLDLYSVLVQARESAINSYIAGVRGGGGETSTLAMWDASNLDGAPDPKTNSWPKDLEDVIANLRSRVA